MHPSLAQTGSTRETDLVKVKPHRWALSFWARIYRRLGRRWDVDKHVRAFCRPMMIERQDDLSELDNPALIIANHTSHFDTVIALSVLPEKVRDRTAIAAAADRMYRQPVKGMLHSLRYNAFPITRGGGREALTYSQWLLRNNWSLLIFPEGKRSRSGELMPFHPGPAILALGQHVPVLPIYIDGAINILPPGSPKSQPAPVTVRIGKPFTFSEPTTVLEAKQAMEDAIQTLVPDRQSLNQRARLPVLANRP